MNLKLEVVKLVNEDLISTSSQHYVYMKSGGNGYFIPVNISENGAWLADSDINKQVIITENVNNFTETDWSKSSDGPVGTDCLVINVYVYSNGTFKLCNEHEHYSILG